MNLIILLLLTAAILLIIVAAAVVWLHTREKGPGEGTGLQRPQDSAGLPARTYRDGGEDGNVLSALAGKVAEIATTTSTLIRSLKVAQLSWYVGHLNQAMDAIRQFLHKATEVIEDKTKYQQAVNAYNQAIRDDEIGAANAAATIAEAAEREQKAQLAIKRILAEIAELERQAAAENLDPEEAEEKVRQRVLHRIKQYYGEYLYSIQAVDQLCDFLCADIRNNPKLIPVERNRRLKIIKAACEKIKEDLLQNPPRQSSSRRSKTGPQHDIYEEV
jgi:hypothetical protein